MTSIPIIGTLYQWWCDRSTRQELDATGKRLQELIHSLEKTDVKPMTHRALELIKQSKENSALKSDVAKLERIYIAFLSKTCQPLPPAYLAKENQGFVETFAKMGISYSFLLCHPEFLSAAKKGFWQHYFPFVNLPVKMVENELFIPMEQAENTRRYAWRPWSEIKTLNLENFRVTYEGLAIGHPDKSKHLVPLKTVDAGDKYALQFVTTCPVRRGLPSSIDVKMSGHSFTQMILPKQGSSKAEVYSVGYFPRAFDDLGWRVFKTVPGVYRNHDSNVSRIQAKQVTPFVKQYLFEQDRASSPCLFSLVQNMSAVCSAIRAKNGHLEPITMEQINKAITEQNEPELDRIFILLTQIRTLIAKGQLSVNIPPMNRREKMLTMMRRFEAAQGTHPYQLLGSNCTAVSFQQESFAVAFLDAKLDYEKPVKVYDSQMDIRDHKWGILDRIREVFERIALHFFAAFPLTGPLLGTGSTHPDAAHFNSKKWIPSILSETAFATHQFLTATVTTRPLFPAGEVLARHAPVLEPPGFFARLKYLWNRDSLLG